MPQMKPMIWLMMMMMTLMVIITTIIINFFTMMNMDNMKPHKKINSLKWKW